MAIEKPEGQLSVDNEVDEVRMSSIISIMNLKVRE